MKRFLKLLSCIILSTAIVYFFISNVYMLPNTSMTSDFIKNGTEQDIINYCKQMDETLNDSLNTIKENTEVESEEVKEEAVEKEKTTEKKEAEEEKEYKNINELILDYPVGTTYYLVMMSVGELQIQLICLSCIFGIIIGTSWFMFSIDKQRTIKQIAILYIINVIVTVIAIELVQIIMLAIVYGQIAFVPIEAEFILMSTAIFLFTFAINKAKNDKKSNQKIEELKEKINEAKENKAKQREIRKKK